MTSIEEQRGQVPQARFGHTTTMISSKLVILFGGAISTTVNVPYIITNDTYVLDITTNTWERLSPEGSPPPARAAHAACCVDQNQMVVYGGATGNGTLTPEELYLLDYKENAASVWLLVPVQGETPGRRYGHSMVYHKPHIIVYGGNIGSQCTDDIWFLDVESTPFTWSRVNLLPNTPRPPARVYHSAEVCRDGPASGMMVVFGGRTSDNAHLSDIWGLRQHRNRTWDWVEAPSRRGPHPAARCQHSSTFIGQKLYITGGRCDDVSQALSTAVYSTAQCEWTVLPSVNRFRHAAWGLNGTLYAFGGFSHNNSSYPTNVLQTIALDVGGTANTVSSQQQQLQSTPQKQIGKTAVPSTVTGSTGAAVAAPAVSSALGSKTANNNNIMGTIGATGTATIGGSRGGFVGGTPPAQRQIRLANEVIVSRDNQISSFVHKVALDQLGDESRKLRPNGKSAGLETSSSQDDKDALHNVFINSLLLNQNTMMLDSTLEHFPFDWNSVASLCDQMLNLMRTQPTLLKLRAPIKVYGDIHGQYADLMRMFSQFGGPFEGEGGDIETTEYLFLGDYVDRGSFSLETLCLLFALKLKFPGQVHLLRGNHEDPNINAMYGFQAECRRRLNEDVTNPNSCWARFNAVFEWMPLGAVIEDRILCIHGGIGGTIHKLEDIAGIERPLKVEQVPQTEAEQRITDLLWSDPTDHDNVEGITVNETRDPDGTGRIFKFGPDRVHSFCENNDLDLIIRAHECVMDGFERFAGGKLITLFSATDYCSSHKNAGALLFIRRDCTVVPKIIYPTERALAQWDATNIEQRPPTPPRAQPRARQRDDF